MTRVPLAALVRRAAGPRFALLAALALAPLGGRAGAQTTPAEAVLRPHKAVYELSLASSRGSQPIDRASGRISFDFGGAACDGYSLQFRQVMRLEGQAGERVADVRSTTFEDGRGRHFTFNSETRLPAAAPEQAAGRAERENGALKVSLRRPATRNVSFEGAALFPSQHLGEIIAAARAGRSVLEARVFDGSQKGEKIYDTTAIIGAKREGADAVEAVARQAGIAEVPRWPVTISYFEPGQGERTPIYTIGFELFENGISRALKLDYGSFVLNGTLSSLETSDPPACRN